MGRGRSLKIGYTSCFILLLLVSQVVPQNNSRQFVGRNLCTERTNGTITDNFSCTGSNVCFPRSQLCDGTDDCGDGGPGSDEGDDNAAITCDPNDQTNTNFRCGNGAIISLDLICDGTDDCASGEDETNSICDNKCLLNYYGGCSDVQVCVNSRNSQNCAGCVDGFVAVIIGGFEVCEILLSLNFENTAVSGPEGGVAELCVVLNYSIPASINRTASVMVELTFTNGTAFSGIDYFPPPATFTLDSNMPRQCINVSLASDIIVDGQEFFMSQITTNLPAQQVTIGGPAQVIITDGNTAAFAFTAGTFATVEETQEMVVTVELVNNVVLIVDTDLYIIIELGTNAPADDAAIITGANADLNLPTNRAFMVTFPANSAQFAMQSVTIDVVDDIFIENAETFRLVLARTLAAATILDEALGEIQQNDDPLYAFSESVYSFVEQDGIEDLTLLITNGVVFQSGRTVMRVVTVTTADGTATGGGVDYDSINMAVTFSAINGVTQTIPLTIQDDGIIESTEDLSVSATNVATVTVASAVVNLLDDDLVAFQFVDLTQNVDEGDVAQICVRLVAGILTNTITVTLTFVSGSATASQDFIGTSGTLAFDSTNIPGTNSAVRCLDRNTLDDDLVERTESFTVVGSGANFTTGDTAEVFIIDNEQAVFEIIPSSVSVDELANVVASIDVRLTSSSGELTFSITIDLQAVQGTAIENSDFNATSGALVFQAGTLPGSFLPFLVPIIVNPEVENQEFFTIDANIQADGEFTSGSSMATVNVTINDLDTLTVGFQQSVYNTIEGQTQVVCLAVSSGTLASGVSLTAHISTIADGTAISDSDFNSAVVPQYVTFVDLSDQCVTVTTLEDTINEATESFTISATTGDTRLIISPDTARFDIIDDDLILFQFTMTQYRSEEGGAAILVCMILVSGSIGNGDVTIDVTSVGGTATPGMDYMAISETLTFEEGSSPGTVRCFNFTATDDVAVEYTETILLSADSARATFTTDGDGATILIEDNNNLVVVFMPHGDITVPEDVGWLTVCAGALQSPQQVLERSVTFSISFKDGTAISIDPKDYQAKTMQYTITPATLSEVFCKNVTIIDDQLCEYDEYFTPCLNAVSTGVVFQYSTLNITIIDNDVATITGRNVYSVGESQGELSIFLTLVGQKAPGRSCVVTWSTMDGTARGTGNNNDYEAQGGEALTFTDTVISLAAVVAIRDDRSCEGNENFQVFLSVDGDGCQLAEGLSPINITIVDDELNAGGGDDPHFSIVLPSGKIMCFTVQGEHGFSFNLISNNQLTMNAKFVPDARRSEVTWMGTMGIIVHHNSYGGSNMTKLRFEVSSKTIHIGDKVNLQARNIEKLTFKNGKLTISEAPPVEGYKVPSIYVDLEDVEVTFTMKFMKEHLDIYWHRTGMKITDSHGLIGQFFRKGVEIDEVRKILIMPNKEPVPVMRRPIWSFMERKVADDQMCWTAMNPGYQGEGLIDGTYFDYLVDDVMSTDFKFSAKKN